MASGSLVRGRVSGRESSLTSGTARPMLVKSTLETLTAQLKRESMDMSQADVEERPSASLSKSQYFRVIRGSGVLVAASSNEVVIQVFSEYPAFSSEPDDEDEDSVRITPTGLVREIEVSITLTAEMATDLEKTLAGIRKAQAERAEATS